MTKGFLKRLATLCLAGVIYFSPLAVNAVNIWANSKFQDIGEGYKVREIGNQRQFYIGNRMGLALLAIDENGDGTFDKLYQNMPFSAFMSGPGYRLMETETTATDRERFEKAKNLLSQKK